MKSQAQNPKDHTLNVFCDYLYFGGNTALKKVDDWWLAGWVGGWVDGFVKIKDQQG